MTVRIGTSGWTYPPWRGVFYPDGLVRRRELSYLASTFDTVEINGSFYSLQRASSYRRWAAETPDDFVFAVKGGRFVTHLKKLRGVEEGLANFLASGPLALGDKLGPILWQLPPNLGFDADRIAGFLDLLPHTFGETAALARGHGDRVPEPWTDVDPATDADRPLRHAMEVRHPSYRDAAFVELLAEHGVTLVVADTAGTFPRLDDVTADLVYVRLHGEGELYAGAYSDAGLDAWAGLIEAWNRGERPVTEHTVAPGIGPVPRDVVVYFDNDIKVDAPFDAQRLIGRRT